MAGVKKADWQLTALDWIVTSDEFPAASTASYGVKAVSGLATRSSAQWAKEKGVSEDDAGNAVAATKATMFSANR